MGPGISGGPGLPVPPPPPPPPPVPGTGEFQLHNQSTNLQISSDPATMNAASK